MKARNVVINIAKNDVQAYRAGDDHPAQLRAARALLDWTRDDLADKSGVAAVTCIGFEHGKTDPKVSTFIS
jgi:DNA-binding XRE family transcriptional regulator